MGGETRLQRRSLREGSLHTNEWTIENRGTLYSGSVLKSIVQGDWDSPENFHNEVSLYENRESSTLWRSIVNWTHENKFLWGGIRDVWKSMFHRSLPTQMRGSIRGRESCRKWTLPDLTLHGDLCQVGSKEMEEKELWLRG